MFVTMTTTAGRLLTRTLSHTECFMSPPASIYHGGVVSKVMTNLYNAFITAPGNKNRVFCRAGASQTPNFRLYNILI